MKHFPKYLAIGIVAMGGLTAVTAQQLAPPRAFNPNPALSVPPAAPGALPSAPPAYPGPAAPPAGNRTVQRGVIQVPHGLVTAIDDVKVPARDAGSLTKLYVKGGELVNADVVLGEIDNRDTLAKQRIAQGELDAATAQANSKAEIEAAKKGRDVALAEYQSALEIKAKNPGAISDQELRRAKFQWERAVAQIQVAETDNLVAGLTAVMKRAQLDATDIELGKKKIEAPIQGQIVEVYKKVGEWVTPGDPVLRLVRLDRVRVEGFVYAAEAGRGDVEGKPVKVIVDLPGGKDLPDGKKITLNGRVDYASPLIEGSGRNRQYRIWAEVENQFVNGHFLIQPGSSAELQVDILAAKIPAPQPAAATALEGPAPAAAPPALNFGPRTEAAPATTPAVEALKPVIPAAATPPTPAPAARPMSTKLPPTAQPRTK